MADSDDGSFVVCEGGQNAEGGVLMRTLEGGRVVPIFGGFKIKFETYAK